MALIDDLKAKVSDFARDQWGHIPDGYVVPGSEAALTLGNTGVRIDATVLYADIRGSTPMVDSLPDTLAAEYYKAYLHCAAKIVKDVGGSITAYDGDRLMAIFVGDEQANDAIHTALKINCAVIKIINPQFSALYQDAHRDIAHTVGIDSGILLAAKAGVRQDTDLVWIGPAANYAAKLNSFEGLDGNFQIRATAQAIERAGGVGKHTRAQGGATIWSGPYSNLDRGSHFRTNCWMDI
jgi:class 3 adenylate cyclase